MPCTYDPPPSPTQQNRELKQTAKLLAYLMRRLRKPVPKWVLDESRSDYSTKVTLAPMLCELLTNLKKDDKNRFEQLVYDARNYRSRELANWWEDHQKADKKRKAKEAAEAEAKRELEANRQSALSKLNEAERKALGIR